MIKYTLYLFIYLNIHRRTSISGNEKSGDLWKAYYNKYLFLLNSHNFKV